MTTATLFTPDNPSQTNDVSDDMSNEAGFNRYSIEADAEEDSNEVRAADSQAPTESAHFRTCPRAR